MRTRQETGEAILRAAEAMFAERGFHQSSMDEIAERAGVAKGTIFYNFGSKAGLFSAVLRRGMTAVTNAIRGVLAAPVPAAEQIGAIIDLHVATLLDNPGLIAIFSRELSGGIDDEVTETIRRTRAEHVGFVAGLLDDAARERIVKPLDGAMLASALFDLALSACAFARSRPGGAERGAVCAFLRTLILQGIEAR